MAHYGTISWRDAKAGVTTLRIADVTTQSKLETLAGVIEGYSNAGWTAVSVQYPKATPTAATDAEHRTCRAKAILILRDSANNDIVKVTIPAPKASIFEYIEGKTLVSGTVGAAMATAMSTATGLTLTYLSGKLLTKQGK